MKRHDEALEVLLILRRRLLDRMAGVIVANRESLLNGRSKTNNPLAADADLAEMIRNLGDIDRAIAGLADLSVGNGECAAPAPIAAVNPAEVCGIFGRFVELVQKTRLEEASQELSRMLQMPLDRATTATRFFARSMKTDATLPAQLGRFWSALGGMTTPEATRSIMRIFGFQAVEARMAMQTLMARINAVGSSPAGR
ncbi:MAG TPA: hypothetical protein VNT79_05160 [Phycisphaerae bacterium]|nr:hypothetical protein [Phycisphaerae bacterium]